MSDLKRQICVRQGSTKGRLLDANSVEDFEYWVRERLNS
jgi:hypothetical protein